MISLLALGALVAALQDPAPGPTPTAPPAAAQAQEAPPVPGNDAPRAPGPVLMNSVQLIVNDECLTLGDLNLKARQAGKQITNLQEYMRLLEESAEQLIRDLLMVQAGRDLGYEEPMVRSMVRGELDRQKEAAGSIAALAQELDRFAYDSAQLKVLTEDKIYRELWQGAVTGKYQGPGGRQYVDRYVRPGQLLFEFERQGSSLDLPTKVQLQEMILAPALGESIDSARQKAQLVRSRLQNGEDFYELNGLYGLPGSNPDLAPINEADLAAIPEIRAFVDGATPGDVSEVLPALRAGQVAGFRLLRFVGRQEGQAASFVDRQFQTQLTRQIQGQRDTATLERALGRLKDAAFVWTPAGISRGGVREPSEPSQAEPAPGSAGAPPAGPTG